MKPNSVVDVLILQLSFAESPEAERAVVEALAEATPDLTQKLIEALASLSGRDAATVCRALGLMGPGARQALSTLQAVAERRSMLVLKSLEADAAERAIVAIRADEPKFVMDALADRNVHVRAGALDAIATDHVDLSDDEAEAVAEILAEMLDDRSRVASSALMALQSLGARAPAALPRLIELTLDNAPPERPAQIDRARYIAALGAMGRGGLIVGPTVAQLLTDRSEAVRTQAAILLRKVGPQSVDAIPHLLRALDFTAPSSSSPEDAAERTEEMRSEHQTAIRVAAVRALGDLGEADERVLSALTQATRATEAKVRYHAVTALGRIGSAHDEVTAALDRILRSEIVGHVRRAAARAIGLMRSRGPQQIAALADGLRDVNTRKSAAWALRQIGDEAFEATPALIDSLDPNDRRRMVVVQALVALGPEVLHDLRQGMHRDEKWRRIGCVEAVAAFGTAAQAMGPTLRELLFDRREDVREAAQEALEAISGDNNMTADLSQASDDESSINEQTDEEMHTDGT